MDLLCEKYNEKVDSDQAHCSHPVEYCRFRTSCMIHFIETEKKQEERLQKQEEENAETEI